MENIEIPIDWFNDVYSVPYTRSTLRTMTVSSLTQVLLKSNPLLSEEEAIKRAKSIINNRLPG